jgi:hypothetical protein
MPTYSVAAKGWPYEEIWGSDPRQAARAYAHTRLCAPSTLITVTGPHVATRYRLTKNRRLWEIMRYATR